MLPQRTGQILDQMERGELSFTLSLREGRELITRLDRAANRLTVGLLLAALIVGLALLIPAFRLGEQAGWGFWIVVASFFLASVLGVWLVYNIWSASRQLK